MIKDLKIGRLSWIIRVNPTVITQVLKRGGKKAEIEARGSCDYGRMSRKVRGFWLRWRKGAASKGHQKRERQDMDFSLVEPPEWTLGF